MAEDEGTTKRQGRPTYGAEVVDELPVDEPAGRRQIYFDLLTAVKENPGRWHKIAHFSTPNGANLVNKQLNKGERELPPGTWEFKAVKVKNPTDVAGKRHSELFARLVDDDEEGDEDE